MKKIILLTAFIAVFSTAFCQYFTVKLGGGYSFPGLQNSTGVLTFQPGVGPDPAGSNIIPLVNYNTSAIDSGNRYKSNLYNSYSRGGHFDFSFGYMINPYFGIQIDGAYLWGSTITGSQTYDDPLLGPNATIITKTHSNGLSLNPSLVFRAAKPTAKWAPYARAGIALPIAGAIYHDLNITAMNSILAPGKLTNAIIDVKTESTVSIGFQGSVGLSYTPVPLISIWAELQGQYLFVKAKQATVTNYTIDIQGQANQNMLGSNNILNGGKPYSNYSTTINFVDQLNANSNTTEVGTKNRDNSGAHNGQASWVDERKAHDELRQVANIGAFGISIGVTFNMSKKIFKDPFGKKAKAAVAVK